NSTGFYFVNVSAGTAGNAVTKTFSLFVNTLQSRGNLTGLPTASLGDFTVGSSGFVNVSTIFGGVPPYTVSLLSGSIPPGFSLIPGGPTFGPTFAIQWYIAGVPTAIGSYSFRLHYTDSSGLSADRTVSMNITQLSLATLFPDLAVYNTPYSAQLQ